MAEEQTKDTVDAATGTQQYDIKNLDIVRAANILNLKYDDLVDRDVDDKLHLIFNKYSEGKKDVAFSEYVRKMNSELGYKPGIHPIDKIYSYLSIKDIESVEKKKEEAAKKQVAAKKKANLELQRQREEAQKVLEAAIRNKRRIEKEKELVKIKEESFNQKVKLIKQLVSRL